MKIFGRINEIYKITAADNMKKTQGIKKSDVKSDEISISNRAKEYQLAMKALKNVPDIREEKVASVKEKMNRGAYDVIDEEMVDQFIDRYFDQKI